MKVLLIYPKSLKRSVIADDLFTGDPLALEYLAAALAGNHDVSLLDMRFEDNFEQAVESFAPDIVGLTGYTFHVNAVKEMSQKIKKLHPQTLIVVGGHHATVSSHDFYEPYIDVVVRGEGVFTFKDIVERFEKRQSLVDLEGVSVNVNGKFKESSPKIISDLDKFPLPNRTLRDRAQQYSAKNDFRDISSLITSQGCPFRCNFCSCWKATGGRYITRDLHAVVEELKAIEQSQVHFADDESFIDEKRMMQLAELIDKAGVKKRYYTHVRSDTISKYPDLFRQWKDVGLTALVLGLEAHREEDLKFYNKKSSVEQNIEAINFLKETGILVVGSFIVRQNFDEKDFDDYADFVNRSQVDIAFFSILTPLPGTQLYKEQQANLIIKDYDFYDFFHTVLPTKLPLKNFYREFYHLNIKVARLNVKGLNRLTSMVDGSQYVPPNTLLQGFRGMKHAYLDHQEG